MLCISSLSQYIEQLRICDLALHTRRVENDEKKCDSHFYSKILFLRARFFSAAQVRRWWSGGAIWLGRFRLVRERDRSTHTHTETHSTPLFLLRLKVPKKKNQRNKEKKRQPKEKKRQKALPNERKRVLGDAQG